MNSTIQQPPNISNDDFLNVTLPANVDNVNFNLTGLTTFTNYTIHMTVSGDVMGNAPIENEVLARTSPTSEHT